jgi:small subunit ribosomal protein S17
MADSKTGTQHTVKASGSIEGRGLMKTQEGVVVSNKMKKTVVVEVRRQVKHAKYGKYISRSSRLFAHDEENKCQVGDRVRVVESRPLSRHKNWRVQEIVTRAV